MSTDAIPEQGQLAQVRKRQYIVTDVSSSTLPVSPLDLICAGPQHLAIAWTASTNNPFALFSDDQRDRLQANMDALI